MVSQVDLNGTLSFSSSKDFYNSAWDTLAKHHQEAWLGKVRGTDGRPTGAGGGGKLALYRGMKCFPNTEPYVICGMTVGVRRVFAGLRAGCLPLEVELGRYTQPKTPVENRTCKLCHQETEDQEHFITRCAPLNDIRTILYNKLSNSTPEFADMSDHNKCKFILQSTNNLYFVCKTLYKMYITRNNLLFHS